MFNDVLTFLSDGITAVFTFFGTVFSGGISIFWVTETGLTDLGELLLMGALIGLGLWGINFIRRMIPFVR